MKRPIDPRNHGLKKPLEFIIKDEIRTLNHLEIQDGAFNKKYLVKEVAEHCNKMISSFLEEGVVIIAGPFIHPEYQCVKIRFQTSIPNHNFVSETIAYNMAMEEFENQIEKYNNYLLKKRAKDNQDLDEKISRCEKRLANLKATKSGDPLPYSDEV